jgi:hypothetical protein
LLSPPIRSPFRVLVHNIQPVALQGAEQEAKQTPVKPHPVPVCKRSDYQVFNFQACGALRCAQNFCILLLLVG